MSDRKVIQGEEGEGEGGVGGEGDLEVGTGDKGRRTRKIYLPRYTQPTT